MDPGPLRDALTLVLGVLTGVLSGAFGVGGAVISTPGIRLLGASALMAVGTTLPSILPSAVAGTARYVKEGLVDWPIVATVAPLGVAGAVAGSLLSHAVPGEGHWLMVLTAGLLGVTAVRIVRTGEPPADEPGGEGAGAAAQTTAAQTTGAQTAAEPVGEPVAEPVSPVRRSLPLRSAVGLGAGLLSGLLGVGGGAILLPAFLEILRLRTKVAVATSLACVGILAVPSTVAHAVLGDIDWRFALLLAVAVIPGARLGAALAIRAGNRRLRLAVALVLGGLAVVYGVSEVRAALS